MTFPGIDLTRLDLTTIDLARVPRPDRRAVTLARDAAYVTIGFGILGFQRAQVARRDLEKALAARFRQA